MSSLLNLIPFLNPIYNFYFGQVHKYQVYIYTFLVDCGHFELSGANDNCYLEAVHISRSDKPLKQNHYITVLETHDVTKISLFLHFWSSYSDMSDISYFEHDSLLSYC